MFFGRNEECGLRCVYHGWKFDRHGTCIDMPSEPPDSLFKNEGARSRPTRPGKAAASSGPIWARTRRSRRLPITNGCAPRRRHRFVSKTYEECNWLQASRAGSTRAHSSFAHRNDIDEHELDAPRRSPAASTSRRAPTVTATPRCASSATRTYVRAGLPLRHALAATPRRRDLASPAAAPKVPKLAGHLWIPLDDETTYVYNTLWSYDRSFPLSDDYIENWEKTCGRGKKLTAATGCSASRAESTARTRRSRTATTSTARA